MLSWNRRFVVVEVRRRVRVRIRVRRGWTASEAGVDEEDRGSILVVGIDIYGICSVESLYMIPIMSAHLLRGNLCFRALACATGL